MEKKKGRRKQLRRHTIDTDGLMKNLWRSDGTTDNQKDKKTKEKGELRNTEPILKKKKKKSKRASTVPKRDCEKLRERITASFSELPESGMKRSVETLIKKGHRERSYSERAPSSPNKHKRQGARTPRKNTPTTPRKTISRKASPTSPRKTTATTPRKTTPNSPRKTTSTTSRKTMPNSTSKNKESGTKKSLKKKKEHKKEKEKKKEAHPLKIERNIEQEVGTDEPEYNFRHVIQDFLAIKYGTAVFYFVIILAVHIIASCSYSYAYYIILFLLVLYIDSYWKKKQFALKMTKVHWRERLKHRQRYHDAQWVQSLVDRTWDDMSVLLSPTLQSAVQSAIDDALKTNNLHIVEGIEVQKFHFGKVPPEITGILVDKTKEHVFLNLGLSFDSASKIVLWVKTNIMGIPGIPILIEHIQLRGTLRFILLFENEMPFLCAFQMAFVKKPKFSISIRPVMAVDIMQLPILQEFLNEAFMEAMKTKMVLPNQLLVDLKMITTGVASTVGSEQEREYEESLRLQEMIEKHESKSKSSRKLIKLLHQKELNKLRKQMNFPPIDLTVTPYDGFSPIVGRILIESLKGKDLIRGDILFSDPYAIVHVASQIQKTEIIKRTLNPSWKTELEFVLYENEPCVMDIQVMDWDRGAAHDFLGVGVIDFSRLTEDRPYGVFTCELHGVRHGRIVAKILWFKC